jgi:glyoxylase-like metal-dependent hydrolase (beta-lactamase superfamily II)
LADGVEDIQEEGPRLSYPFAGAPEIGEAVDVAPGVKWMRIPIQGPLRVINVWAIAEDDGWAIVDTGMAGPDAVPAWRALFAGPLEGRRVTRVFVTHMHPDHIGMAGWLTRKHGVRLWITRLEFLTCHTLAADTGREAPDDAIRFLTAAGWSEEQIDGYRSRFGNFGKILHPLPDSFRRLTDGQELTIGGRRWRIVVGSGHSPEHACFCCPELALLISGDQVLPRTAANVGVFPTEPDADPLSEWLSSLARLKTLAPDDVLVLPAHDEPFFGLHARIDGIIARHQRRLDRLRGLLREPRTVLDLAYLLYRRRANDALVSMTTGESLAHLNHLLARGEAVRRRDEAGVDWYSAAA